jgi:uncharacterized repeat protein (TIGR03803 family)
MLASLDGCDPDLGGPDGRDAPPSHTIGGSVSGLAAGESLVLLDNGTDALTVASNGTFTFQTAIQTGSTYAITVASTSGSLTCSVAAATGAVGTANIANVVVTCAPLAFALGGSISGLNGAGLVLANGTDSLGVAAGATSFTLPTPVATGSSYTVSVRTQPAGVACSVTQGSGIMPTAAVTSVRVSCTDQPFSLGGHISGLGMNTGLVLANGTDSLSVAAGATTFIMPTRVPFASSYAVTVQSAPTGLSCQVTNGAGIMPANNLANVAVACATQAFPVGGTITGLTAAGLVLADGADLLSVTAGATHFTMPLHIPYHTTYLITVNTQPSGLHCTVSNGAGLMGSNPVTNVVVTCAPSSFTVGGSISGVSVTGLVLANGSDTLNVMANAMSFSMPSGVANGAAYDITVKAHPPGLACNVTNGSGLIAGADVTNVAVACAVGSESVFYSFGSTGTDGAYPYGSLMLASDGNFYVTTSQGGQNNAGTVMQVTPAGVATVIWSFGAGADGAFPYGSLIEGADGALYGTTNSGGTTGGGTVFRVTTGGAESVLYSFGTQAGDGQTPNASLIMGADGAFYGTCELGGSSGLGTVFRLTTGGSETVLHAFSGADGQFPNGDLLLASDGNFYGLTVLGGTNGQGTVFQLTPIGGFASLWSFGAGTDGRQPYASLIQATDGNLYGMTQGGGVNNQGTVFSVSLGGTEAVLYSFGAGSDGQQPSGSLIQGTDGFLYGMTQAGGSNGTGAVFSVDLAGTESVIYSFGTGTDGQQPGYGYLLASPSGDLYGITSSGGNFGVGAIIKIN